MLKYAQKSMRACLSGKRLQGKRYFLQYSWQLGQRLARLEQFCFKYCFKRIPILNTEKNIILSRKKILKFFIVLNIFFLIFLEVSTSFILLLSENEKQITL